MSFADHLRADLTALRRSRAVLLVSASALFLGALLTGALSFTHGTAEAVADLATAAGQGEVLIDPITGLLLAALVAAYWGAGFRDGSVLWSFLASPSRARVAAAGLLASAVLGCLVGVATIGLKVATLQVTLPPGTTAAWWHDAHGRLAIGGALVSCVVLAVVAAGIALVTRSAPAAIAILFGWMLVIEPLLVGLLPRSTWTWLPAHALSAIRNAVVDADLVRAGVMVAVYTAAAIAIALAVTARRDPA